MNRCSRKRDEDYNNRYGTSNAHSKQRSNKSHSRQEDRKHKRKKKRYSNSSSSECDNDHLNKSHNDNDNKQQHQTEIELTNLINFTFLDYKSDFNKILLGYSAKDKLIDDEKDFWLFVNKYENLLKKSGQCILPEPFEQSQQLTTTNDEIIPKKFNKFYNTNLMLSLPFEEILGRLSSNYDRSTRLTQLKIKQFLQIIIHYLDFKQKEKFTKLKKLRKTQQNLPVSQYRQTIIDAVHNEQVILIAGDTGCGKSTQIPQYLHQAGFQNIACTQPRRIACISLSKRVSHEMLCEYGTEVGYQIRFERNKSTHTKILFITEGLLLRQLSTEGSLSQYDVLVLDEVHERHLHGDFLLGVSKCLLRTRPELKLILMSATINIKLFSDYFTDENCKVIEVPGRLYPIKLHYMPQLQDPTSMARQSKAERLNPEPYVQIMQLIDNKYPKTEKGDLLIFMSGLNEITSVIDAAKEYSDKENNWIILPLHSTLSIADQDKVFDYAPDGIRKCIISTNIAETSITIDGIRFVIDSGKVKEMSYDPVSKMQRLKEFWISQASAEQRKGRAGRTGPGVCYRLYAEKDFNELESYSTAEIHRVPLESLLLQMISMGLPNARLFPFIESPPPDSIENSILSLKQHDALTVDEKLTSLGQALSRLPVDITIGKMLLMGCVFQQLQPVLTMAAALSIQTPFTNRAYRDHDCEIARKHLESDHGDPITILNAYKEWLELKQARFNRNERAENTKNWCKRRGLEEQRFYEITKLRKQFEDLLRDCGLLEDVGIKEGMSSGERAMRHGELKQLKDLKRAHKNEAPKKRKLLKSDPWGLDNDDTEDNSIDIRDVDFRLSHDSTKINNLLSGAIACSYRDLMTLKLILVSGLYPQIAIADEFNYCKSASQQFYHTETKPFTSLHPMGFFANNPQILQLTEPDIMEKSLPYRSKLPLSSKHQILCYLSLLETTKAYLMNTLRMPGAQTLLLFAHTIETNATFSRIVCDSWICLDFPLHESGQLLLLKASNLRRTWSKLLAKKLEGLNMTVENQLGKNEIMHSINELELDLWYNLSLYMNCEIGYTLKRLLTGDLKSLYVGPSENNTVLNPNPFAVDFECVPNLKKGGVYITENICYNCIIETDWSIQMENDIVLADWECSICLNVFHLNLVQRMQHKNECNINKTEAKEVTENSKDSTTMVQQHKQRRPNTKEYKCTNCNQTLYLTSIEILKHKKSCLEKE